MRTNKGEQDKMLVKTETDSIKVSEEEKKAIQEMANEQNTTVSRFLYAFIKKNGLI